MTTKELERYRELSEEMRKLPRQLAAALGDTPPVGLQLFLCCNLGETWKQPRNCADPVWDVMKLSREGLSTAWLGQSLEPPPLTDVAWAQFMASNNGKLPKEIAAWEKWERFPDRTACCRYYGLGNKFNVWCNICEIVTKAGSLLREYEKLNVPEELDWTTPVAVRSVYNCCLPDYSCMLELICRQAGHCGDENLICVEEAGLTMLFEETVFNEFLGEIKLGKLERASLELFQVDDFCTAFAKAIEVWIPENAENAEYACDPDEDVSSEESPQIAAVSDRQKVDTPDLGKLYVEFSQDVREKLDAILDRVPSGNEIQPVSTGNPTDGVGSPVVSEELKPNWANRELWLGDKLIKRFRQKVGNQETVLAAFQEEDWPHSIDDPLSPAKDKGGDFMPPDKRRRDTVRGLNSKHQSENLIRFETWAL
jgi:hypothetical protein